MIHDERVRAVADFGFTERQARFLVLVMRHAGVCVPRQYANFAGIANGGRRCNAFFDKLVRRGYAAASHCVHNRARLYHVHHKPLYYATGEARAATVGRCRRAARGASDAARCGARRRRSRVAHDDCPRRSLPGEPERIRVRRSAPGGPAGHLSGTRSELPCLPDRCRCRWSRRAPVPRDGARRTVFGAFSTGTLRSARCSDLDASARVSATARPLLRCPIRQSSARSSRPRSILRPSTSSSGTSSIAGRRAGPVQPQTQAFLGRRRESLRCAPFRAAVSAVVEARRRSLRWRLLIGDRRGPEHGTRHRRVRRPPSRLSASLPPGSQAST